MEVDRATLTTQGVGPAGRRPSLRLPAGVTAPTYELLDDVEEGRSHPSSAGRGAAALGRALTLCALVGLAGTGCGHEQPKPTHVQEAPRPKEVDQTPVTRAEIEEKVQELKTSGRGR